MTRTALYRFHDANGNLLYVGITDDTHRRWTQHAHSKHWWPDVVKKSVEWHDTRGAAEQAESRAIEGELPRYNVIHGSSLATHRGAAASDRIRSAYERLKAADALAEQMQRDVRTRFGAVANEVTDAKELKQEEVAGLVGRTREWLRRLQVEARRF